MSFETTNGRPAFYVYTPVDGEVCRGWNPMGLDEAKSLARQSSRRLANCGLPVGDTVAYVIADDDNAEIVWHCDAETA